MKSDFSRICWNDEAFFYYGTGNPSAPIDSVEIAQFREMDSKMPNPIYRDELDFYHVTKQTDYASVKLKPLVLDPGYIELFSDILAGTLGMYPRDGERIELWRRYRSSVKQIECIEDTYGVKKACLGVNDILFDILHLYPELAPKKVVSGLAIGNRMYGGLDVTDLTDDIIPKHMVPETRYDLEKAKAFFNKICPDPDSQHNLLLATVYPYYKRSNEKFFLLKGVAGNGKSSYMEHFPALIGDGDKYSALDLELLGTKGHTRDSAVAGIQGKLVLHSPDTNMQTAEQFKSELKRLATADRMQGRTIGTDTYTFKPDSVLFIDTNEPINIEDSGGGAARRQVGIIFAPRKFSHVEFEPYFRWCRSREGAVSIFMYAYNYFQEECEGQFTWNDIDVDANDVLPDRCQELVDAIMSEASANGIAEAYLIAKTYSDIDNYSKKRVYKKYGLVSKVKSINGKAKRVITVGDEGLFADFMEMEGYSHDK
jgi:hypothetical protein